MSSVLMELLAECVKIVGMVVSALVIRWFLELSTPSRDYQTVRYWAQEAYESIRIPQWWEWFNMDRLTRLRDHPDVTSVLDGSIVVAEPIAHQEVEHATA